MRSAGPAARFLGMALLAFPGCHTVHAARFTLSPGGEAGASDVDAKMVAGVESIVRDVAREIGFRPDGSSCKVKESFPVRMTVYLAPLKIHVVIWEYTPDPRPCEEFMRARSPLAGTLPNERVAS